MQSQEDFSDNFPVSSIKQSPSNRQMIIETSDLFTNSPHADRTSPKPSLIHSPFSHISERTEGKSTQTSFLSYVLDASPDTVSRRKRNTESSLPSVSERRNRPSNKKPAQQISQEGTKAATNVQKNWRAYQTRKLYKDELIDKTFITILAQTISRSLEKKQADRGANHYYVLMMYNHLEDYISIHVKNLVNKKFYKAVVKPQRTNTLRNGSLIPMEEISIECNDLLRRLSILDGCIVILEDPKKSGKHLSYTHIQ